MESTYRRSMSRVALVALLVGLTAMAIPSASAEEYSIVVPGCTGQLASDLQNNPTWENLFGDVGRWIDCAV